MLHYFAFKMALLKFIKEIFEMGGIAIITFGGIRSLCWYVWATVRRQSLESRFIQFRTELGQSIISGLELLIAADVISTLINVTYEKLGIILVLVILRSMLSFVLSRELVTRKTLDCMGQEITPTRAKKKS